MVRITKRQAKILEYLRAGVSQAEVSRRLKISRQAVSKVWKKVRHLHRYTVKEEEVDMGGVGLGRFKKVFPVRLHGFAAKVRIISKMPRFEKRFASGQRLETRWGLVLMYRESAIVYLSGEFEGTDELDVTEKATEDLGRVLRIVENQYGVVLVKSKYPNVRVFRAHYAEVGNELAVDCRDRSEFIQIFGSDDGKLWAQIDASKGVPEFECLHPERSYEDFAEVIRPFFQDLRDSRPPNNSELYIGVQSLVKTQKVTQEQLHAVVQILKVLIPRPSEPVCDDGQMTVPDYFG